MTTRTELQRTDDCVPIDRFGTTLTDAEQSHVQSCARCEAELALWQEFTDSTPTADEGAAVQWIVSELHRRTAGQPAAVRAAATGWLSGLWLRSAMGVAAAAVLAIVAYVAWDPEPRVGGPAPGEQIYRTATVDVVAPTGDVPKAPAELTWKAVDGAVRYDVQILEVDRTTLWRATSPSTQVSLPGPVIELIVPGKTLLWEVTAVDASGISIASSGAQRFRVSVGTSPGRL